MSDPAQSIVLQPGSEVTLQPSGRVQVKAAPCPEGESGSAGPPWPWPDSVVALRFDQKIVGAVPAERLSAPLEGVVERAPAESPELGDVNVVGVMGMDDASEAVVAPAPGEPLHVMVAGAEIDVDAYRPLLDAAARTGGHVEFVVPRTDGG